MKKNKTAAGEVLAFPYKSFSSAYKKPLGDMAALPNSDALVKPFSKYYSSLYEKYENEIIEKACCVKHKGGDDLAFLPLVPLKVIDRLNSRAKWLQKYVRFFLGETDKKPEYPLVDIYEVDMFERVLFEDISFLKGTFWLMAHDRLKTFEGCYDNEETFISELDFAFTQYIRQYELMGDDAVWNLTFKLKMLWRDLIGSMLDIAFAREESDGPFDVAFNNLRSAFQRLPLSLYRLECRRYQELSKKNWHAGL